ncbi:hypothetical protein BJQ97_02264 [Geobacillus sp. TFV-3]|nr:hypothetical protein BJQ97_02264 [Geobacillus sp. TFV-3]
MKAAVRKTDGRFFAEWNDLHFSIGKRYIVDKTLYNKGKEKK